MNIFKRFYNYISGKVEESEVEKVNNTCKRCNGIGIVDHENAEFRTVKHWCECKVVENGRPPGGSWAFDIRWRECYKMVIMTNSEYHKPLKEVKALLPRPELTFEPYIKLYIHDENKLVKIITFEKKYRFYSLGEISTDKKVFHWDHVDIQSWITDEDNKVFLIEMRDKKLKELGIK